ncbi:HelD family protein [Corynebacterium kozikiae]|uniref:HelD family protein n=1 Tax=Corynebacterium kozikiae TaxID=2968469 RepID=UPI00211D027E|nr:AAA family ATPase [Corynebacterium sp. 76QC2CO]MCQ9343452.1 AAA family ATPase [Corynebacterium sp. 76QC2CO]
MLFHRLDSEVAAAQERLRQVMLRVDPANPDAEALVERETEYHGLHEKIDRLNLAQLGLVFGRIDVQSDSPDLIDNPVPGRSNVDRRYIGRMGLLATEDDYRSLLLDWRAPLARPFYLATTAHPEGVETRRHIRTRGKTVTAVDEEILQGSEGEGPQQADPTSTSGISDAAANVAGEQALLRAIGAARTRHMASIVQTIQREQDEIIRDEHRGVMVVEGGPGTGKTAVALHRVAYLLYTWREMLAKTGVLIVGPNRRFLEYISRVLPELGETGVVLATVGELYPGVKPTPLAQSALSADGSGAGAKESLLAREVKGSEEMVTLLDRLVKHHQRLPDSASGRPEVLLVDNIDIEVTEAMVKKARTRARRTRRPHNEAQPAFAEALTDELAQAMAAKIGSDPLGGKNLLSAGDVAQLHDDLAEEPAVAELVERYWPKLEPTTVLGELLGSKALIAEIAFDYDEETQAALWRANPFEWAESDAALLDELATKIGILTPEDAAAQAEAKWREQLQDAEDALEILRGSANTDLDDETDAEILSAHDVLDAEALAGRQEVREIATTAQRAAADHQWAYGHVIVDEAQELTPMEWRMIMRRSPSRWMTLVGDTSQTSSPAGVDSWEETLAPYVANRFRKHALTVNYRTPAEIMDLANQVLKVYAPNAPHATALRSEPDSVRMFSHADSHADSHGDALAAANTLAAQDPGRLCAVIAAESAVSELRDRAQQAAHDGAPAVEVYAVSEVKGLEFDHVVLHEPAQIVSESPQGWQDLYVALTRATQTLTVCGQMPVLD